MTDRVFTRILMISAAFLAICTSSQAQFRKGISLPELFTFPLTRGVIAKQEYIRPAFPDWIKSFAQVPIQSLQQAGFDHVRITADLGPAIDDANELEFLKTSLAVIAHELSSRNLGLILTLLAPALNGQIPEDTLDAPNGVNFERYANVVVAIASIAKEWPARILFEPMNEPQQACSKETNDWQVFQRILVKNIREAAPLMPLLLTGGCWSKIEGIGALDSTLLSDPNIWISIHFYDPFVFTHQGTAWALPLLSALTGVPFPARAGSFEKTKALSIALRRLRTGREKYFQEADAALAEYFSADHDAGVILREFEKLESWRQMKGIKPERLGITEFGAVRQVLNGVELERSSRLRWLHAVRQTAESLSFGWTVWSGGHASFGILEADNTLAGDTAQALGIEPIHKP